MPNLENRHVLHIEFPRQKLLRLYHNTYILLFCRDLSKKPYRGLWFNRTHLPLFQNISVKIYTIFFIFKTLYDFKINYLKDKMRHEMWVQITIWRHPNCKKSIAFGTGRQKHTLNLTGSEPHPHVSVINFARWSS